MEGSVRSDKKFVMTDGACTLYWRTGKRRRGVFDWLVGQNTVAPPHDYRKTRRLQALIF